MGGRQGKAQRGRKFDAEVYNSTELSVCPLAFGCIDYGDHVRQNTPPRKKLGAGDELGTKKCAVLAMASALAWIPQGRTKRFPPRRLIDTAASSLRLGGFICAEIDSGNATGESSQVEKEIAAVRRDIWTAHRECDYQAVAIPHDARHMEV